MDLRLLSFALRASSSLLWPWLPSWEWGGLALLLALPSPVVAAGGCCFCCSASSGCRGICTTGLPGWISWAKTSHIITARAKYGVFGREEGINLRACCCASTPWTIAPHQLPPLVRGQCHQVLPPLPAGSRVALFDLSQAGPWPQPTEAGNGWTAPAPLAGSPPPATCARSSPWDTHCPVRAIALAMAASRATWEDGAGPCWQPSPSAEDHGMPSGNSFAAAA